MPNVLDALVFAPRHNTGNKKDATGAFVPEARAFAKRHGVPLANVVLIDNTQNRAAMRAAVLRSIDAFCSTNGSPPACCAFFCHGLSTRLQLGFDKTSAAALASALSGRDDVRVVLYACSTARGADEPAPYPVGPGGDGGFADELRDALCRAGALHCQVDAHSTAGHATRNPYVRRFEGMGSPAGGAGGYYLVTPKHKALWPNWRKALRDTPLRFDFPLMAVSDIHLRVL